MNWSYAWWRHQMETFSALLAICVGNSPLTSEFSTQRPVTLSFDVFFDLRLIKRLSKQSGCWWFETPSRQLWRHCYGIQNEWWYNSNKSKPHKGVCTAHGLHSIFHAMQGWSVIIFHCGVIPYFILISTWNGIPEYINDGTETCFVCCVNTLYWHVNQLHSKLCKNICLFTFMCTTIYYINI